jgi:hypothetical protein
MKNPPPAMALYGFELEQEGCAERQLGERRAGAGLPEVELVEVARREVREPRVVGDTDPELRVEAPSSRLRGALRE